MKNFFGLFKLESLKHNLKTIIVRFPITVFIVFIVSGLLFTELHGNFTEIVESNILRGVFSLVITFFLSLAFYITCENYNNSCLKKNIFQIFPIIFGIIFYIGFTSEIDNFENFVFFLLTIAGIISYLFFAPYVKNIYKKNVAQSIYYTYFYKISVVFLISTILGAVLFALGNIAIVSVFELFDISWADHSKITGDWAITALSFFTPIFALTQMPSKKSYKENHFNENVFFSFLVKYIAVPFIYIYFIILYAYTVKVLSNFSEWPKGEVSWMVIGFSIFGYITYIFSYIFEQKNKFIATFRKAFPYVVIPQIFMLAYAIYLRIAQYDITINRYFVVVFGIWLAIISLYFIISRKKHLSFIPIILTVFTIIISIGPWSVYSMPETRQYNRLTNNLEKAGILVKSEIVPLKDYTDIDKDLSRNIYSGIDYVCDFNNCKKIKELFPNQYKELYDKDKNNWEENREKNIKRYKDAIEEYTETDKERVKNNEKMLEKTLKEKYKGPSRWEIIDTITDSIKVKTYYGSIATEERPTLNFNIDTNLFPISTIGYTKIIEINDYKNDSLEYAKIDIPSKTLKIYENSEVIKSINIDSIITKLEKLNNISGDNKVSKENLTFEIEGYKILLRNIRIKNPEYKGANDIPYFFAEGFVLIK